MNNGIIDTCDRVTSDVTVIAIGQLFWLHVFCYVIGENLLRMQLLEN